MNIVSTNEHYINTRTLHQHPNTASTAQHWNTQKYCINNKTLHKHQNNAATPKKYSNTQTMHQLILSLSDLNVTLFFQKRHFWRIFVTFGRIFDTFGRFFDTFGRIFQKWRLYICRSKENCCGPRIQMN